MPGLWSSKGSSRNKMIVAVHKSPNGKVIAICDKGLIGKKFEEGKLRLDMTTNFYKGEEMPEQEVLEVLKTAYIVNLVGKKAVNFGLKNNIINKENIIKIKNIPMCQCVVVRE